MFTSDLACREARLLWSLEAGGATAWTHWEAAGALGLAGALMPVQETGSDRRTTGLRAPEAWGIDGERRTIGPVTGRPVRTLGLPDGSQQTGLLFDGATPSAAAAALEHVSRDTLCLIQLDILLRPRLRDAWRVADALIAEATAPFDAASALIGTPLDVADQLGRYVAGGLCRFVLVPREPDTTMVAVAEMIVPLTHRIRMNPPQSAFNLPKRKAEMERVGIGMV
ncbi:hypothetical protein AA103196_2516 [Ameyamaea chiangmaiensis NBRC 103196]|uniref:Luciferase-like domain-containing protein n=1 Tax=Ameyamaea chiangmaiensis TaxID=442969 RepID=A0A850PH89_9PROT|nr:hypothetical protein [Ameyamaea chiangmaiensis]MBS4075681.1 hypothetical protein [Ameyamaea chiangmaiensis]NVN41780.1 hypothetical protein [Ameyamaea chiangmaiensis]GBQ70538.1 hypothetical protein AA103196_2516 [Ameyamaea chiangmaiensis NBRC 103196]